MLRASPDLSCLFHPRSIAVVGASKDLTRIGGMPIKLLMQTGFRPVYAVNPKYDRVENFPCFPSLEDIPEPVDLVIIATAAGDVLAHLERAHRKGIRAAIVFASGFAETGDPEGAALQSALVGFADRSGMAINGPNSIGIVNWANGVFATFGRAFSPELPVGRTALLGQSGNISATVYRIARKMNVLFSYAINTGNEAALNISDYLVYLADEPNTDAILFYLEALRDAPKFMAAARRLRSQGKLLAVYKAGTSEKGAEAARSHTAALTGDHVAYETALRACGVAIAEDLAHLAELAYMHRYANRKFGKGVAIVSVSGAAGAIIADGVSAVNLAVPTLPAEVQQEIRTIIPPFGMSANPVDLTGNVTNNAGNVARVVTQVLSVNSIDILFLYLGGLSLGRCLTELRAIAEGTDRLMVVVDTFESGLRAEVEAAGIAFFEDISQAVRAVSSYAAWKEAELASSSPDAEPLPLVLAEFRKVINGQDVQGLSEKSSKAIFSAGGLKAVNSVIVGDSNAAAKEAERIGFPVVLKLVSPDVAHKTEIGGVALGLKDRNSVQAAYHAILKSAEKALPNAKIDGISVEPQIEGAIELLLGVVRDHSFGWMMTVGLGGIWAELMGDVSHALLPVDVVMAESMLRRLKSFPLLEGFRGSPPADIDAACRAIASMSATVLSLGDLIIDCEVNPLLVLPKGKGAFAADALITLSGKHTT
jgi:acyl-CoA synthetase (NDP forming)